MMFAEPGQFLSLPIARIERNMAYLDSMGVAIPISLRELTAQHKVGDVLDVFIWTQRNGDLIATMRKPKVVPGEIAFLQVINMAGGSGFVDIGLDEDAVLYTHQQDEPIEAGHRYYMTMVFDATENRLVLTTRVKNLFSKNRPHYKMGDEVHFLILEKAERGRKVVVDNKYIAYLPEAAMLPNVRRGDRYRGYVTECDRQGFLISMYRPGREKVDEAMDRIMDLLGQGRGYLRLNDNTPAEEIQQRLKVSKKTFKQAVGQLYKAGKVELTPRGIKLKGQA